MAGSRRHSWLPPHHFHSPVRPLICCRRRIFCCCLFAAGAAFRRGFIFAAPPLSRRFAVFARPAAAPVQFQFAGSGLDAPGLPPGIRSHVFRRCRYSLAYFGACRATAAIAGTAVCRRQLLRRVRSAITICTFYSAAIRPLAPHFAGAFFAGPPGVGRLAALPGPGLPPPVRRPSAFARIPFGLPRCRPPVAAVPAFAAACRPFASPPPRSPGLLLRLCRQPLTPHCFATRRHWLRTPHARLPPDTALPPFPATPATTFAGQRRFATATCFIPSSSSYRPAPAHQAHSLTPSAPPPGLATPLPLASVLASGWSSSARSVSVSVPSSSITLLPPARRRRPGVARPVATSSSARSSPGWGSRGLGRSTGWLGLGRGPAALRAWARDRDSPHHIRPGRSHLLLRLGYFHLFTARHHNSQAFPRQDITPPRRPGQSAGPGVRPGLGPSLPGPLLGRVTGFRSASASRLVLLFTGGRSVARPGPFAWSPPLRAGLLFQAAQAGHRPGLIARAACSIYIVCRPAWIWGLAARGRASSAQHRPGPAGSAGFAGIAGVGPGPGRDFAASPAFRHLPQFWVAFAFQFAVLLLGSGRDFAALAAPLAVRASLLPLFHRFPRILLDSGQRRAISRAGSVRRASIASRAWARAIGARAWAAGPGLAGPFDWAGPFGPGHSVARLGFAGPFWLGARLPAARAGRFGFWPFIRGRGPFRPG